MKNELNDKEQEVVARIKQAGPSGVSIAQLAADCFKEYGAIHPSRANSWVRNSLRWPVALGMVHKTARGRYAKGPGSGAITPAPTKKQRTREAAPRGSKPRPAPRLVLRDIGPFASADVKLGDLDLVVPTRPMVPSADLAEALAARPGGPAVFDIGDCAVPRTAFEAMQDAAALGHRL